MQANHVEDTATRPLPLSPIRLFQESGASQIYPIYPRRTQSSTIMVFLYFLHERSVLYYITINNSPLCDSAPGTTALSASVGIAPTHSRSRSGVPANDEILPSSLPPSTVIEHLKEPPLSIHALKKKGQVFKCESCAKVYRHPSWYVLPFPTPAAGGEAI